MYGLRPVSIQTTLDSSSPYVIDAVDGQAKLLLDGKEICEVYFPKPLKYYTRKFEDGTAYHEIIAFGYFVTVFRNCQYWGPSEECRFCDININARQMKESKDFTFNAPVKPVEYMVEVARSIEEDATEEVGFAPPIDFLITGGTILKTLHGKDELPPFTPNTRRRSNGAAAALREPPNQWPGQRNHEALQGRGRGLSSLEHGGLGQAAFRMDQPGEEPARRVGMVGLKVMIDEVDVFGEGNVRPNFVGGVEMAKPYGFETVAEAVKSTSDGVDFMMRNGIIPRFNQWRREPGSNLVSQHPQPAIPLEYYLQLMGNYYDSWKKYGLPMPRRECVHPERRIGSGHGTYDDILLLNELPDYEAAWDRGYNEGLKGCITTH